MIFWFSATGNSLHVARELAPRLGRDGERLVSIAEAMKTGKTDFELAAGERVLFVLPVYYYGLPIFVESFVSSLTFTGSASPRIDLVLTCGSGIGGAGEQFTALLEKRGWGRSRVFAIPLPDNYVISFPIPGAKKQARMFAASGKSIPAIAESLLSGKSCDSESRGGVFSRLSTALIYPLYRNGRYTRRFSVDKTCTGCGLCAKICPVGAIELVNGKPVWKKAQCAHCLACINRCPAKAIEYGKGTQKRGRYVNPLVHVW